MLSFFNPIPAWLKVAIAFPLLCLNAWLLFLLINYLEPLVTIFVTAALLAFLLDFPIRLLQQNGISRGIAIALVFLIATLVLTILAFILVPIIVEQLRELINNLPKWVEAGNQHLQNLEQWAIAQKISPNVKDSIIQLSEKLSSLLKSLTSRLLNFILGAIGSILNILFILVLTIFFVLAGEPVWDGIFSWLPSPWDQNLRDSIRQTFEGYFTGQAILAVILSIAQTIALAFLNVPYSTLFGVMIGLATLIPYASAVTIICISILLMLNNVWLGIKVLVAAIIIGQINENVISPRLMGDIVGLNPVWIIISIFIGGKLGGILGLLIAVPLASIIKMIADQLRGKPTLKPQQLPNDSPLLEAQD